jgi:hypothetical protein
LAINGHDRGNGRENHGNPTKGENNMKDTQYLMASQIAGIMGSKWSRQRVHTELKRGKFPEPTIYVGNQPLWTPEQIEKVKKERGINE